MYELLVGLIDLVVKNPSEAQRIARKLISAFDNGLGAHLAATLLLGLATICLRTAIVLSSPDKGTNSAFDALLVAEHEPMREEIRPSLAATITTNLNWQEDARSPTRRLLDEMYVQFQKIYAPQALLKDFETPTINTLCGNTFARWQPLKASTGLKEANPPATPGIGEATIYSSHQSTIRIPSTLATAKPSNERYTYALTYASAINPFSCLVGKQANPSTTDTKSLSDIKSVFFISTDGLFAITPPSLPRAESATPLAPLPAHRLFTSASYFSATIGGAPTPEMRIPTPYISRPYLDLLGNGIVTTTCYPVLGKENPQGTVYTKHPIHGIFCIDTGVPQTTILNTLQENALLKTHLVRIRSNAPTPKDQVTVCQKPQKASFECPKELAVLPEQEDEVRALANEWLGQSRGISTAGQSNIKELSKPYYAATVWKASDIPGEHYIAIFSRRTKPVQGIFISFSIIATTFVMLAVYIIARSRLTQERRMESALIRALQGGVIRCDEKNVVMGGNDRAEEILNAKLPRLGLIDDPGSHTEMRLFNEYLALERVFIKDENGTFSPTNFKTIDTQREAGLSTIYWALVVSGTARRWIRVTGSPIITPNHKVHSFGLIELANHDDIPKLEQASLKPLSP
ncbi:MAG TPA: hypothetical protein VE153_00230 [Myxococcus sp.]|nr:hypothetical protein [Myxococcus sp.]